MQAADSSNQAIVVWHNFHKSYWLLFTVLVMMNENSRLKGIFNKNESLKSAYLVL